MQRISGLILCLLLLAGTATTARAGFLYVMLNKPFAGNQIYGFSVNETTGATALLAGFPVVTGGTGLNFYDAEQLTIDRANNRLYAVNEGSDTISAYSINAETGALTALPFSPITLGEGSWPTIAVHPSGSPLVISNDYSPAHTYSFVITATTATQAPGSPYLTGSNTSVYSSAFSYDGNFFYTGGSSETFAGFSVNPATGGLTPLAGSPFDGGVSPLAFVTDRQGRLFMANYTDARVRVFQTTDGIPTQAAGSPVATGLFRPIDGVLHPNGNFYFVVHRDANHVASYQISGTGTATTLTAVNGSPFASGGLFTHTLAINRAGTFLYAANGTSRNLTTYSVNSATGVLTNIAVQPENTLGTIGYVTGMDYVALPVVSVSISGRVLTAGGSGIFLATVYLTDISGNTRTARTNPFGYYRFPGVRAGESYTFAVRHKRFSFAQQTIAVTEKTSELNLTAEP